MKTEDVIRMIKNAEQVLNQNRGGNMESYLEGRLSAFEDIQDILKREKEEEDI